MSYRAKFFALLIASAPVSTAVAQEVQTTGSFFSRYELRRGYAQGTILDGDPGSDLVRYRARLGLHVEPLETETLTLGTHFVPQAGGFWHVGGDDLVDPVLGLHEAFVDVATGPLRFEVGRFEMVYGDHLVIGNVGWHHLGRAFDGFRVRTAAGDAWVDVFFTALSEGFVEGFGDPLGAGDTYFTGAYAGLGKLFFENVDLDLYALSRLWPNNREIPVDPTLEPVEYDFAADLTPGVRVKGTAGVFDFRAEQGLQLGTRPALPEPVDVLAYQGDVELGLDFRKTAHVRVAAEAFYATGDDPESERTEAYDHLYPTAHKWMGLMDFVGARTNVYGGIWHTQLVFEPVAFALDVHSFWRPFPADDTTYLGTEVDAGAAWAIAKPLKLRGLYGIFLPETKPSPPASPAPLPGGGDPLHFAEFALEANF